MAGRVPRRADTEFSTMKLRYYTILDHGKHCPEKKADRKYFERSTPFHFPRLLEGGGGRVDGAATNLASLHLHHFSHSLSGARGSWVCTCVEGRARRGRPLQNRSTFYRKGREGGMEPGGQIAARRVLGEKGRGGGREGERKWER